MPPLYNKEFSVNFEPSSFDKFFSSVEYIEHNLEYINKKIKYIDLPTNGATTQKRKSGRTRSF